MTLPLRPLVTIAILAAYLVLLPAAFASRPYVLTVIITASLLAVMSLGVWLTFAIGRINIGQAGFAMIGGYLVAILTGQHGVSFWVALPLSTLAAVVGFAIGYPILRLKGVYFAMLTLCLNEAIRLVFLNWTALTRGASGLVGLPLPGEVSVLGITLVPAFRPGDRLGFYYLAAILLIVAYVLVQRIEGSRLGAILRSLRQNEDLAASIGINVPLYRAVAFAIAAALGSIGGAVFTTLQQNIYPTSYQVTDSVYLMMYCFVGGLATPAGAIVGTFALVVGFEVLGALGRYQSLVYAAVMIASMMLLPNGIASIAGTFRRLSSRRTTAVQRVKPDVADERAT